MDKEEALKHIKTSMNLLYDTMHPMPKAAIMRELSFVKSFLEFEPKSNQLTNDIRNQANNKDIPENIIRRYLLDTCDIIDRKEAENKELKEKLNAGL